VFFIVISSGKWRRGGHRRPSSSCPRRAGFLLAPVNGAFRSNESIRTGPGWRSVAVACLFFTGLGYRRWNSNLAAVGRGSVLGDVEGLAAVRAARTRLPRERGAPKTESCRLRYPRSPPGRRTPCRTGHRRRVRRNHRRCTGLRCAGRRRISWRAFFMAIMHFANTPDRVGRRS
jgi:hypothetical protein